MKGLFFLQQLVVVVLLLTSCGGDDSGDDGPSTGNEKVFVSYARLGSQAISQSEVVLADQFYIGFTKDVSPQASAFQLEQGSNSVSLSVSQGQNAKELILMPNNALEEGRAYKLSIADSFKAVDGATFSGQSYNFTITTSPLNVEMALVNGAELSFSALNKEVPLEPLFQLNFSHSIDANVVKNHVFFSPTNNFTVQQVMENSVLIRPTSALDYWKKAKLNVASNLGDAVGRDFNAVEIDFFTTHDDTPKFPTISDEELLTKVQEQTFKYFWDFGHPVSGMARERSNSDGVTVTSGGTGFGLMAMVAAVERGFITRAEAVDRWQTIVNFLETADRFHGAWPHWMNGSTGEVRPFSAQDDGADLVETAFLVQGLLTVKEYLNEADATENALAQKIDTLWREIEWTWFQKNGEDQLYWHWSPEHEWHINLKIRGHNETQIVYVLAAASPTYPITESVYTNGYARNGQMANGNDFYSINLPLGNQDYGGPLFFTHYSYLGLDPRNLQDQYANYWTQNKNHSLINHSYCEANPSNWVGYSTDCWGLTASDSAEGYSAHSPTNDLGVITPTAAISSLPYTPTESMDAIKFFYYNIGDRVWGEYGFVDAFSPQNDWYAQSYLAIDQGPIVCMIENYRTGLLWDTFMQNEDVKNGLDQLNFTY